MGTLRGESPHKGRRELVSHCTASITDGCSYAVTVLTQPSTPPQTCNVTSGSGTLAGANVTSVVVTCVGNTIFVNGFEP